MSVENFKSKRAPVHYEINAPLKIYMRGISSTNLVNKEVSVQAELKIDLSKLRHEFFFQRKLRVHTLRIWKRVVKKGARGKPILV